MWRTGIIAAVALAGMAAAKDAGVAERVVAADGMTDAAVAGVAGRVRLDPGAPGLPMMTDDYAARAGLKGGGMLGFGVMYAVGPERVHGRTQVARIRLGAGAEAKRRIGWTDRPYAAGIDGVVGPMGVAEPVVRFVLRPAVAGERIVALPMIQDGGLFADWFGTFAAIDVGGAPLRVRFDPHRAGSVANAGAALRIAAANGGRLADDAHPVEVAFGIARPVRTMTLARALAIGPVALSRLGVRTGDGGDASRIAAADAPAADPDEVVVVAKGKPRDLRRDRLAIGGDDLAGCSSIVFDKPRRQILLSCR